MTQYVINIGAIPNDGTGDPLRTAFNETNLNFDQVFAAGPVLSNIQIANNTVLTTNTNGNLILAPNGTAVVQSNVSILPNLANLRNLGSATQRWATIYAQSLNVSSGTSVNGNLTVDGNLIVMGNVINMGNIVTDTLTIQLANTTTTANAANGAGITVGAADNIATILYSSVSNTWTTNIGISSVGNISAPYLFGNGSQLIGLPASYSNANVVTLLAGFGSNTVSTTGNISGGYFFGNVSQANGFPAAYGNANVATFMAAFGSNTISTTGNITTTANVSGGFILGNVAFANGISTYGNANVVANLAALGSNPVSTTGNVTGGYILGNGSGLTSLPVPTVTQDITSNGAMSIMTYDGNIKYVNYATVEPSSGNIASGNITTTGLVSATGNITAGNINSPTLNNSGNISVVAGGNAWIFGSTGNLTLPANTFSVNYANGNAVTFSGGSGNTGNVTFDDQVVVGTGDSVGSGGLYLAPGNTSVGNLQYLRVRGGDVATHIHLDTGNNAYFDQYFGDDGKYVKLEAGGNVLIGSDDAVGNAAQWTFGSTGNLTVPGGGAVFSIGTGTMGVTANATSGNAYLGLDDTGSTATLYGNAGVQIGTNGNVGWNFDTAGNLTAPGNISAVGNVTGGNVLTGGLISATGNVTAGNISTGVITLTNGAVIRDTAGDAVAFGQNAGASGQAAGAVAIGVGAGQITQQLTAVAVGDSAGYNTQGLGAVGVGAAAGFELQGEYAVALGYFAGNTSQGNSAVAIGRNAGYTGQGGAAVAIGYNAGVTTQGTQAVAIGINAGVTTQGNNSVAIGPGAGASTQGTQAVAIGTGAGETTQGNSAVAVGYNAGLTSQGNNSVAIGQGAGQTSQAARSIILNATGSALNQTTADTFTVKPVRQANTANAMYYDASTGEITYDTTSYNAGTPAWTSAGAITLTATTTNPTKGTTTSDNISYRQLGAKQWEVVMTYIQTVANGVNGSGDYLFTLPNGLSFDTTLPSQQITTTNIGTNTYTLMTYIIPSGSGLINNGTLGGQVYPLVYNATKFRILTTSYGSGIQCWGSGYYSLGGDDPQIQLTFRFTST